MLYVGKLGKVTSQNDLWLQKLFNNRPENFKADVNEISILLDNRQLPRRYCILLRKQRIELIPFFTLNVFWVFLFVFSVFACDLLPFYRLSG